MTDVVDPAAPPAEAAPADAPVEAPAADANAAPEAGAPPADAAPADAPKAVEQPSVPETYEPFTMPEGVELQPEVATDLTALAKDLGLTQEQAQKVADLGAKQGQRFVDAQAAAVEKARTTWREQITADKDLGGDNLNATLAAGKGALEQFGTPELRTLLDESGLGDHPEVIRFFAKVGKATGNDKIVTGQPPAGPQDAASKLYPTMAQG